MWQEANAAAQQAHAKQEMEIRLAMRREGADAAVQTAPQKEPLKGMGGSAVDEMPELVDMLVADVQAYKVRRAPAARSGGVFFCGAAGVEE